MADFTFSNDTQKVDYPLSLRHFFANILPNKWKDYQWIIDKFEAEFGNLIWKTFNYDNGLAIRVDNIGIHLKHTYHGKNAKSHYEEIDGERKLVWDDPDWQVYDILALEDPKARVEKIIKQIKEKMQWKQRLKET